MVRQAPMTQPMNPYGPPPNKRGPWRCMYFPDEDRWAVVRNDDLMLCVIKPTEIKEVTGGAPESRRRAEQLCAALNRVYGMAPERDDV